MADAVDANPTGKTILIVDDEFGVLEVVEYILTDFGHTVTSALNGRDALARVEEKRPDLIILDFMMPIMDGGAFLQRLRANPAYRDISVILTSALPEETIRERCVGYQAFLRKPYKFENLLETMNRLLEPKPLTSDT
jgi:CheY-like chemotaxis protein